MSSTTSDTSTLKPSTGGRLPSLNQLAARININATNGGAANSSTATTSAPRPRLAAFALRTGSNASLSTVATNDSVAVNPPSTRSTSPSAISVSPPQSTTPSNDSGEPLTKETLEKHDQEVIPEKRGVKVGYKNIPSLDAITARLAMTRALSIDGTSKPPEPEMIEDPKTPGIPMKAPEHPLEYPWYVPSSILLPAKLTA